MTIEARMADGRILEFPDGTDPHVIQATVKKLIAEKAVQESKLTTDTVSNSLDGRKMKIYKFKAPDGNTYRIEGPDGATELEIKQALLEQNPEAFIPAAQHGFGLDAVALLILVTVIGFGIAFYIERKLTKSLRTKAQKIWLMIAATSLAIGLTGIANELVVMPYSGLSTHYEKVFSYTLANIFAIPAISGLVIWMLQARASSGSLAGKLSVDIEHFPDAKEEAFIEKEQPTESIYAQALHELEGGNRNDGLWAKCFAEADGAEHIAKAQYIKIRVPQIQLAKNQAANPTA
jgi:hypothetical protein